MIQKNKNGIPNGPIFVWLTTNKVTTWFLRNVASRLDPYLYKWSNGKFCLLGPSSSMPMVTITTIGRKSKKVRRTQLVCVEHQGIHHIVASAMGQERHPGWMYNIEANPKIDVQAMQETYKAKAEQLTDDEKSEIWGLVEETVPQMSAYEGRTNRNIKVFRLNRL